MKYFFITLFVCFFFASKGVWGQDSDQAERKILKQRSEQIFDSLLQAWQGDIKINNQQNLA